MIRNTVSLLLGLFGKKKYDKEKCLFSMFLPVELKLHILSFLSAKQLCEAASVSKEFRELTNDDSLWRRFFVKVVSKDAPTARVCHSAVVYGEKMYIYGGHVPDSLNYIRDVKNDFFSYHFPTKKWEQIQLKEADDENMFFPFKTEHTAVAYKNCMYLFGGYSNGTVGYRDVSIYEYNFDTRVCSRIEAGGTVPPDRSAHTAVVYKDSMYIMGGWDGSDSNNNFYAYNFETRAWSEVEYTGVSPPCIRSHSAVVYKDSMVVFGGYGKNVHPTSIYIFHFLTKRWEEIKHKSPPSSPLLVHGEDGTNEREGSSSLSSRQVGPCGRSRFRMVHYQDSLWAFGGWDRQSYFADLWRFRLDTLTWHKIDASFDLQGVGQHSIVVHQGRMYLYGGYCADSKAPHPHLYIYRLPQLSNASEA